MNGVFAGEYARAFNGRGVTFDEVRENQPGGEIRMIDWNVAARMEREFIKQYVEEREFNIMLVVDVSTSTNFGTRQHMKAEIAAENTTLPTFSAIKNNDRVGLICFTNKVQLFVLPGKSKRHVLRRGNFTFLISDFPVMGYETVADDQHTG